MDQLAELPAARAHKASLWIWITMIVWHVWWSVRNTCLHVFIVTTINKTQQQPVWREILINVLSVSGLDMYPLRSVVLPVQMGAASAMKATSHLTSRLTLFTSNRTWLYMNDCTTQRYSEFPSFVRFAIPALHKYHCLPAKAVQSLCLKWSVSCWRVVVTWEVVRLASPYKWKCCTNWFPWSRCVWLARASSCFPL